ncbi:MAG TPA: hypothetical protein VNZ22_21405, partial [Bacillota bacterium]|nr:hypothetical protein [Bacillota bacterium]
AGATVWSVFVAGEPVRPSQREGKLLLPLTRDLTSDAPVAVELTFVGAELFPKHRGSVALVSPRFDVPMKNARWDLYLPPDYDYSQFEGSMTRISDVSAPMVQVYSLSEYNEQQRAQEVQQKQEVRSGLQTARDRLSGGNLREAISSFSRAKSRGQQWRQADERDKDLKQVEEDLRKAQGSNLIAAQNRYFAENATKLGDQQALQLEVQSRVDNAPGQPVAQPQAGRASISFLNNDVEIAGQQWDKLEKAQQVAVTKVAPLRVNLPTRGIHYTFSQVLQTEIRKPMTVRMEAENTKVPSWTSRILLTLLGFCGLWLLTAIFNYQRRR